MIFMENGALILEGGSLRTLFTAGVLDVFMEHDLYFSDVTGVSAGALTGVSYVTKQPGRTRDVNIGFVNDKRYLGMNNLLRYHEIFNFDFLFGELSRTLLPLDFNELDASPMRFTAVATCLETGEAVYFEKSQADILAAMRAGASLPVLSKSVLIDGRHYLDGGCAEALPYRRAIEEGHQKIVLILTRQQGYRKLYTRPVILRGYMRYFRRYPAFIRALADIPARYDREQREIDRLEREGRIFVIRPQAPVLVSHTERDTKKLSALYNDGRLEAQCRMDALKRYLKT